MKIPSTIQPYLNEIAERLWSDRAAVMVGAGFSKNASNAFPNWNELGDLLYEKAHGSKPNADKKAYLSLLKVAEEVQAAVGRPSLDNLLQQNIPDLGVEPSQLHVDLLGLPWRDVFTTNYDTLLERATPKVTNRRYTPVVDKEELAYAAQPRIVKLHGSFRADRPFIITEEDYRRYPSDFAPFVNTVQQSLLENTFCLIGFSGDDPNFLQWIGWVRDQIGNGKSQKVYLVGAFDLPSASEQLLAQRGIVLVNMSCCCDIDKDEHSKALKVFFEYINKKRPDNLRWPQENNIPLFPDRDKEPNQQLQHVTSAWKLQRGNYPGWVILPYENRQKLWQRTQHWLRYISKVEEVSNKCGLYFLFELVWRLERCLLPIFDDTAEQCARLIKLYTPSTCTEEWLKIKEAWLGIACAMLRYYREEGKNAEWKELYALIHKDNIVRSLSSEQKEFLHYEEFLFGAFTLDPNKAQAALQSWKPVKSQPFWMTKRTAAEAEWGTHKISIEDTLAALAETRRATIIQDGSPDYTSFSQEAYQMLMHQYIRNANDSYNEPIKPTNAEEVRAMKDKFAQEWLPPKEENIETSSKSQLQIQPVEIESPENDWNDLYANRDDTRKSEWECLLREIRRAQKERENKELQRRWDELKAFRCDPWNELRLLELKLEKSHEKFQAVVKRPQFDVGVVTSDHRLKGGDTAALDAYQYLRLCEEIGLPFRINNYYWNAKPVSSCLKRLGPHSFHWACVTLLRLSDKKAVDELFDRESIYHLTGADIDRIVNLLLDTIENCQPEQQHQRSDSSSWATRLAIVAPEVISRFCCKSFFETKKRIIKFIAYCYRSSAQLRYQGVDHLISRLIESLTDEEQWLSIPMLLEIFEPESRSPIAAREYPNPFPLLRISSKPEFASAIDLPSTQLDILLQKLTSEDPYQRGWAAPSLLTLYQLELLTSQQIKLVGKSLWKKTDERGFPADTHYYKFAFLDLPHPKKVEVEELFKDYIFGENFPIHSQKEDEGIQITGGNIDIFHDILGSRDNELWQKSEVKLLFERLVRWWDLDKELLIKEITAHPSEAGRIFGDSEELQNRFARAIDVLSDVIAPKLSKTQDQTLIKKLNSLLTDMRDAGLCTLKADAAALLLIPEQQPETISRLTDALNNHDGGAFRNAMFALVTIAKLSCDKKLILPLFESVSQLINWGATTNLSQPLWVVIRILREKPESFYSTLETAVLSRLSRLLEETSYLNDTSDLSFDKKLGIRVACATLAAELSRFYQRNEKALPDALMQWKNVSTSEDEFAEIKAAWRLG